MNSEKRRTVFFRAFWRIVILLFVMIPLLWGVRTSLCASNYDKNLIPKEFTLDNYSNLLKSPSFLPGIWNSTIIKKQKNYIRAHSCRVVTICIGFCRGQDTIRRCISTF